MVRQFTDESNGIRQQNLLGIGNPFFAGRRIERIKQPVVRFNPCAGKAVEKRRLTRICITYNRHERQFCFFTLAALDVAHLSNLFQLFAELINAAADMAAIAFEFGFAGAAGTDTAA